MPPLVLARDFPPQDIARHVATGRLIRIGRGVYIRSDDAGASPVDLARARLVGVHRRVASEHCFSHVSAALVLGLPLWNTPTETHLYQRSAPSSRRDPLVRRHHPMPPPADIVPVLGLPLTTLSRTTWDCLVSLHPLAGLVVADAALRAGLPRDSLAARAEALTGTRGAGKARALTVLADPGAESPGESACRFTVLREGLPAPQTQVEVQTRLGTFWADLGWPEWRLLLEYDGRNKYVGEQQEDVFMREKRRHDAVLEAGWRLIRVTRDDLRLAGGLTSRLLPLIPEGVRQSLRRRRDIAG